MKRANVFEILDHPADIGFRATGRSLPELLIHSAMALLAIAGDPDAAQARETYSLSVTAPDLEALLVEWLNEVLYWFDGKRIAFHCFEMVQFTATALEARGFGEPRDPLRHRSKLIVKGVTYHQLKIEQQDGQWTAIVFLDV